MSHKEAQRKALWRRKQEMFPSWRWKLRTAVRPAPANFSMGSAAPCGSTPFQCRQFKEGQNTFSSYRGEFSFRAWTSNFPAPLPLDSHPFCLHQAYRAVAASREQEALRRTKLSICQHHLQIPQTEETEAASNFIESKEQGCQRETDDISWTSLGPAPKGAQWIH